MTLHQSNAFLTTTQVHVWKFDQMRVRTEKHPSGEYSAMDADYYEPGMPVGWSTTEYGAIADLADEMRDRGMLTDERVQ